MPLYFTSGDEFEGRNDYLGKVHNGKTLRSFGVNPGGYMGYYDPIANKSGETVADALAAERIKKKAAIGKLRRGARYQELGFRKRFAI